MVFMILTVWHQQVHSTTVVQQPLPLSRSKELTLIHLFLIVSTIVLSVVVVLYLFPNDANALCLGLLACHWADCGGGSCNKTSTFTYKCVCAEGFYNLLNVSFFPCFQECKNTLLP